MKALEHKPSTSNQTQSKYKSSFFDSNVENERPFSSQKETNSESFFQPSYAKPTQQGANIIQRQSTHESNSQQHDKKSQPQPEFDQKAFLEGLKEAELLSKIKYPIANKLAIEYAKTLTPKTVMTYSGGLSSPEPYYSIDRITLAIMSEMDIKKSGKGSNITEWQWQDRKMTEDEKIDKGLELLTGEAKDEIIVKTLESKIVNSAVEFIGSRMLKASLAMFIPGFQIYGFLSLIFDFFDLAKSFKEPTAREKTRYEKENAEIVDEVKAWLQSKQEAAEVEDSLKRPKYYVPYNPKDGVLRR